MPCLPAVSFLLTRQPEADSNESWVLQKATGEADDIWNKISHNGWQNRAYGRITAPEIPTAAASSAKSKLKWSFSNANDLQHYHHTAGYKGGNCSCQFCDLKCPSFCETTSFFLFLQCNWKISALELGNLHIWIFPWCHRKAIFTHELQTISGESFWDFCYSCLTHVQHSAGNSPLQMHSLYLK